MKHILNNYKKTAKELAGSSSSKYSPWSYTFSNDATMACSTPLG